MALDKTILITGGTGSFGKTMLKHLMSQNCREIRVFSRDEEKQDTLRSQLNASSVKFYIGDIRDRKSLDYAMHGVDRVFHAAALKQVPSCEFFPMEAVQTNINGSANVLDAAIAAGVESVVCLSTDKAVMPVNAMGMSKAMMEKIALSKARNAGDGDTVISCVRYGNVMYSRGSVIPRFIRQIKSGAPITVTDPDMTRFMMHLDESVALVDFALSHASHGDIFVRKAPACTIDTLARALLDLFEAKNEIRIIGSRHGEKSYESMLSSEEKARAEDMGDFFRIHPDNRDLNYHIYFDKGQPERKNLEEYNSDNTERLDLEGTKKLLLTLAEVRAELEKG